jgi:hypothetical protein
MGYFTKGLEGRAVGGAGRSPVWRATWPGKGIFENAKLEMGIGKMERTATERMISVAVLGLDNPELSVNQNDGQCFRRNEYGETHVN